MSFDVTTPAVLFSAVSLLLLAYTNRFLVTANRIRELCLKARTTPDPLLSRQIVNLRVRVRLIRGMQTLGVGSLAASVTAMLFAITGEMEIARWAFVVALVLLLGSLMMAMREISISLEALDLELGSAPY
jgi:hypothetical protein